MLSTEEAIDVLYDILDPEISINIYDLGMVYDIKIDSSTISMDITLTSAGCPLADEIEKELVGAFGQKGYSVNLNWIWVPAWSIDRITSDGIQQLQAIGYPMKLLQKSTWVKRERGVGDD